MKTVVKRVLVCLLMLTMLVPMLSTAVGPALAATTSGYIGNMDSNLTKDIISPAEEAMLNMENNGGIRFATNINLERYAALKKFCKDRRIKGVSVGTLIAPIDYVLEVEEFSTMALGFLDIKTPYLDIKANTEEFYDGEKTVAQGYDEQFVASIVNIKLENRTRKFAAIGYIQLTLLDGSHFTIYSYDNQDMDLVKKYAFSLEEVATKALEKDTWSEEERAKITDLAAPEQKLDIDSANVKDVRVKRNQVFFTYVNNGINFYNRVTYDGANGWRLQTNTKNYNHFKDIGAGQSLALYMSEGFDDITVPLTVTQQNGELIIAAEGTDATAQLAYNTFALDFCGADGVSLYNVNEMALGAKEAIVLRGRMELTEAVYGGGESFDASNKRGKSMSLYISDAYDSSGSYVAIPLFSTSRGGGMFVNRYEPMTITFPRKNTNRNWELIIDSQISDCYFYATGNISDVLQAYVDMTGHASLPEEWAQGYLVCRYAPDFNSLYDINGGTDGVYWTEQLSNPEKYTYTPHLPLTAEATEKLGNNTAIQSKDGKTTYYIYIKEGSGEDKNGNGKWGERYFKSEINPSVYYYSYEDLPNKEDCYYDNPTKVSLADNPDALCHKKSVTYGSNYYNYVIESDTEDFNYNGITGESYFLRVGTRGGPGGAGAIYVVQSLIEAGMKPTGVILEGAQWYSMATDAVQWANLKKYVDFLDEQGIKTLVYASLGYVTGSSMGKNFKSEYKLSINVYESDPVTRQKGEKKLFENVTNIPKSDETNNPDTSSDGSQVYLDITNPAAMQWYMNKVWDEMMDLGIDGVKIDFCESVPNQGYYKKLYVHGELIENCYLEFNWYDPSLFEDKEVHHAYPSYFTSAFYKEMEKRSALREGDTGFVLITRGGGIGSQRNPYIWAGDQSRKFASLSSQLAAVINSGISGLSFITYDMAGYAYTGSAYHYYGGQLQTISDSLGNFYLESQQAAEEYESEIFVRGLQFTVFGNMIQTHGYVRHVYHMTEEAQEIAKLYTALHDELADYLQEMSKIACDTGMPMVRHMILEYQNDAKVADIDNQFMYGDALLLAPILTCNTHKDSRGRTILDYGTAVTRDVYLPAGRWIDLNTGEEITLTEGTTIQVEANLAKIPAYLNLDSEYADELQEIFAGDTWTAIKDLANAQ